MANPFSQKVRQRKFIYTALILALFTGSLMHRRFLVEPQAERLKLREVAKGEAELTGSAVRLALTGSRGLAVTFLWSTAIRNKARHEWNELELVIGAITKLQPYFITPWLFQGWNLAYNVAVECDRPHDKYYYVSRGLQLLAEGERRNHEQGLNPDDPKDRGIGQPDIRFFIGVAYNGKFGTSDEKITMRSLLDLSCIDPVRRNPDRFWTVGADGDPRTVDLQELANFCSDYPRLVRRLRDHLGYTDPKQIVEFLAQNREVPTRFERPTGDPNQRETPLKKDPRAQFPVLPDPTKLPEGPDPRRMDFGLVDESLDVFVVSRAWFEYAQQPVPPPSPHPLVEFKFDPLKYRMPKSPTIAIFRTYPARAQAFAAEVMEEEGWFDEEGWLIRDWFGAGNDLRVGTELKYRAAPAWNRAFDTYRELGRRTGQYLTPGARAALEAEAGLFRKTYKVGPMEMGTVTLRQEHRNDEAFKNSMRSHQQLVAYAHTARLTNFDSHYHSAEAERTAEQVAARKLLYQAERLRRFENPERALTLFETAWPLWLSNSLRYPKFAEQTNIQEDAYELQLKHLRLMQTQHAPLFKGLATGFGQLSVWPHAPLEDLVDASDKGKINRFRNMRGLLDWARVYDVPEKEGDVSRGLLALTQALGMPRLFMFPGQEDWLLMTFAGRDEELKPGWRFLFDDSNINAVKLRLGLVATAAPPPSSADAPQSPGTAPVAPMPEAGQAPQRKPGT